MQWLQWAASRMLLRLDAYWLGLLGLLSAAAAMWLLQLVPLENRIAGLRQALQQIPQQNPAVAAAHQNLQTQNFEQLDGMFPAFSELTRQLAQLFNIIERQGLTIDKGQYKLTEKPGNSLRRFEATLPVSGHYPALRQALVDIQRELPNVGILDLQLQRDEVASPVVNAQLQLVVIVRGAS